MEKYSIDDAILALATPWGESAIAVIRLAGKDALGLLAGFFRGKNAVQDLRSHTIHYGKFCNPENREIIDEVMLAVYREPHSYTGENSAELFCHGSLAIINMVIALLLKAGFRQAGPGEFTQRAFLNGKIDLTRAEAVNEIIRSQSDRARALAMNRLSGAVEKWIDALKARVLALLSSLEIMIDYPDDEVITEKDYWHTECSNLETEINRLLATYAAGRIIQEGITVIIAGKTNAGKSTLFNLLLKADRAIVSGIHGTTRDYLEGAVTIHGIPVRLFDTAGLRKTDNALEIEGIKRTDQLLEKAGLILFVADAMSGLTEDDTLFLEKYGSRPGIVKIWNKIDLNRENLPAGYVPLSAQTGAGLDFLNDRIAAGLINEASLESGEPVIDSLRQKQLLENCGNSLALFKKGLEEETPLDLLAVDLKEALDCLGEITGVITTEDILKDMFSRFCVGK